MQVHHGGKGGISGGHSGGTVIYYRIKISASASQQKPTHRIGAGVAEITNFLLGN